MKKKLLIAGFVTATLFPASAFGQETCDAKKMSFTEFTACAEAALVKDTQGICVSGAKCFDGEAETVVSEEDTQTGSSVASTVSTGSAATINVPSEVSVPNVPVERIVETLPTIEAPTPTVYAEAKPVETVKSKGGYEARVLFALGSAELLNSSNTELDEIATVMLSKPHLGLQIEGHASADGDEMYNLDLSSKRADSVRNALLARGVPLDRLSSKGYGEFRLKDTENPNSPENRRVEMVLDFSIN
jgi:outer membrane protein OmpA-like peptidoglycan-associated protein